MQNPSFSSTVGNQFFTRSLLMNSMLKKMSC